MSKIDIANMSQIEEENSQNSSQISLQVSFLLVNIFFHQIQLKLKKGA